MSRESTVGWRLLLVAGALSFVVAAGRSQQQPQGQVPSGAHARVELIAERDAITPGERFWAGLRFDLEKGWHIYWVNPGDSGEPPRAAWNLPGGFRAGAIEWPTPVRLGRGSVVDYGYEGGVLLMVPITAPANLRPGTNVMLAADVKWLVCSDICIPERAKVSLTLPVERGRAGTPSRWEGLFEQTRREIPKPAPANWKLQAISEKSDFILSVATRSPETKATFFPLEALQIENAAAQMVKPFPGGLRLTLKKSDQVLQTPKRLRGVLVLGGGRAYEVSAAITTPNGKS